MNQQAVALATEVYTALHYQAEPRWVLDYAEYVGAHLDLDLEGIPTFHDYLRFQIEVCREDMELQPGYYEQLMEYMGLTQGFVPESHGFSGCPICGGTTSPRFHQSCLVNIGEWPVNRDEPPAPLVEEVCLHLVEVGDVIERPFHHEQWVTVTETNRLRGGKRFVRYTTSTGQGEWTHMPEYRVRRRVHD